MMSIDNAKSGGGGSSPLRARRLEAGLSQERLARRAGCSTATVRLIEGGWRPSAAMLMRLSTALDCRPEDLKERPS